MKKARISELKNNSDNVKSQYVGNTNFREEFDKKSGEMMAADFENTCRAVTFDIMQKDPKLNALLPKKLDGVTDPQKQQEILAHNQYFDQVLQSEFKRHVGEMNGGPAGSAEAGLEFIKLREENIRLQSIEAQMDSDREAWAAELKAANDEIKRLAREVGTKGRLRDSPLRPTVGRRVTVSTQPQRNPNCLTTEERASKPLLRGGKHD
jgi:hypothetical protein